MTDQTSITNAGCSFDGGGDSEIKDVLLLLLSGVTEYRVKVQET